MILDSNNERDRLIMSDFFSIVRKDREETDPRKKPYYMLSKEERQTLREADKLLIHKLYLLQQGSKE